ncbi:hypothetical protein PUN28_016750 [Cardiocondyla obscurior]|uniref:Uncharacterized protein n=1 Tax=Cardiocondyla obscurior TaxID=286306 RepID=A0AAW2ENN7_9HYME
MRRDTPPILLSASSYSSASSSRGPRGSFKLSLGFFSLPGRAFCEYRSPCGSSRRRRRERRLCQTPVSPLSWSMPEIDTRASPGFLCDPNSFSFAHLPSLPLSRFAKRVFFFLFFSREAFTPG